MAGYTKGPDKKTIVAIVIIRKNSLKAESPELLNSKITDIKEDKVLITI